MSKKGLSVSGQKDRVALPPVGPNGAPPQSAQKRQKTVGGYSPEEEQILSLDEDEYALLRSKVVLMHIGTFIFFSSFYFIFMGPLSPLMSSFFLFFGLGVMFSPLMSSFFYFWFRRDVFSPPL